MNYTSLHCHSHYSLLDGLSRPEQMAARAVQCGFKSLALTDHGSISGTIDFASALKNACKSCGYAENSHSQVTKKCLLKGVQCEGYEPAKLKPIFGCLPKGHNIYTIDGVKDISEIKVGDFVLTHNGRYRKVIRTMSRQHKGYIYGIKLSGIGKSDYRLYLTEEHPVLIRNNDGVTDWITVDKIKFGYVDYNHGINNHLSYVCFPKTKQYNDIIKIDMLDYIPNHLNIVEDTIEYKKKGFYYRWKNFPTKFELDKELAYFIGLYVAEGSINKKLNGWFCFSFNIKEQKYAKFIKNVLFNRFNIKAKLYPRINKSILEVIGCSVPLVYFLSKFCGVGSKNKKIDNKIYKSSIEIQNKFLEGLLDGDGKKITILNTNQRTFKTGSIQLAYGVKLILANLGKFYDVYSHNYNNKKSYSVNISYNSKYDRFISDDKYVYKPISDISIEDTICQVYNFEVEEDNSYVSNFILHNCELYISQLDSTIKDTTNKQNAHLCVLAKNYQGWKNLIRIVSDSNKKENYYYKPRLNLEKVGEIANKNIIAFSGHIGSDMSNVLFIDYKLAYKANNVDQARMLLHNDWEERATNLAGKYSELFGKENFFMEIQLFDHKNLPACFVVTQCLRKIANKLSIPCIATDDAHYSFKEQAIDQRVLLCSEMGLTFDLIKNKLDAGDSDFGMSGFFKSNEYYIHTAHELLERGNTELELQNSFNISEMCENYSVENRPFLPVIGTNSSDELFQLAAKGLKDKGLYNNQEYRKRFQKEIRVLNEAGLADYFLIVRDYVTWARKNGIPAEPRGSAGGCLVSYLVGISQLDPIPAKLIFERFYNDGRNTKDKVSLPDIDIDFSKNGRKKVIDYISDKYGKDKVCGIATFNQLKGRGALKAVFSAYGTLSIEEMNRVTPHIPDPAKVSGELQEAMDEFGESSIIEYAVEHNKKLHEYCYYDDNGELAGPLAREFAQAIRLEGTKVHMGKHAAGIIISSRTLYDLCPMVLDSKGSSQLCGWEMAAAEKAGLVKFDALGVAVFDKLKAIQDLLLTGEMEQVELD